MLIAPVKVGKGAVTGAGSVTRRTFRPGALAVERPEQRLRGTADRKDRRGVTERLGEERTRCARGRIPGRSAHAEEADAVLGDEHPALADESRRTSASRSRGRRCPASPRRDLLPRRGQRARRRRLRRAEPLPGEPVHHGAARDARRDEARRPSASRRSFPTTGTRGRTRRRCARASHQRSSSQYLVTVAGVDQVVSTC